MTKKIKATINYDTDAKHPDAQNAKGLVFTDIYSINTDVFGGDIKSYITNDLRLVAGGGYDSDHIKNVKITLQGVN